MRLFQTLLKTKDPKIQHSSKEKKIINSDIQKLLDKGAIVQCDREPNDFVSTVLTIEKKDGFSRTILNLKYLNQFIKYRHLMIQSLIDVFKTIKKDVWIANVDLKDDFFTVPVHIYHQKFFKFAWFQNFYKWLLRPNADFCKNSDVCFWIFTESRSYFCYIR